MISESASTTSNIQKYRVELVEAKIALRHAQNDYDEAETAFVADANYKELGSNNDIRDQKLALKVQEDANLKRLRNALRDARDAADRAECQLEQWLDERRHAESVTWAKLVDYLQGKVDHVRYAPTQAARTAIVDEATGEIVDEFVEDGDIPF